MLLKEKWFYSFLKIWNYTNISDYVDVSYIETSYQPNLNKALGTLVLSFRYDDTTHYDVIMLLSNHVAMS